MNEEKMLMEIEEKNIFKKVINFIKSIFSKKQESKLTNTEFRAKDNSFINKIEEDRRILNIQKSFESGELKESNLTATDKNNLLKLYNKQIRDLKQDIENYKRNLNSYKEKIIVAKSKLNN